MPEEEQRPRHTQPARASLPYRLVYLLIWFVVLFGVWFVFVDSLEVPEVAAGPIFALLACWVALSVRFAGGPRFRARLRWLGALRGVPLAILRDSGVLAVELWRRLIPRRPPRGAFRTVPFPVRADDPEAAGWRALCIAATSTAPNTILIGIDRDSGRALVHQLVPDPPAKLRHSVIGAAPPPPETRGGRP